MLKVGTLAIAMMASTAAFAVEPHGPAAMFDLNTARLMFDPQPIAEWKFDEQWTQERERASASLARFVFQL